MQNIYYTILQRTSSIVAYKLLQTWGWKWVDLFVGDRHNRVVEFVQEVGDGLVGEEHRHRSQQQVDEDEHHREEALQAGFTESHRWTAVPDVILCSRRRGETLITSLTHSPERG